MMTPARPPIRLLLIGHSPVSRERLRTIFEPVPDIDVMAEVGSSQKAMNLLEDAEPTAILVDCDFPDDGSFTLVRDIMTLHRIPIVMVTKQAGSEAEALQAKAREAGAVALVSLPSSSKGGGGVDRDSLIRTVRTMSEVKVVRRRRGRSEGGQDSAKPEPTSPRSRRGSDSDDGSEDPNESRGPQERIDLVAIGASTGGPQVLETILRGLAGHLTVPVLIVQHLSQGFQRNLINWLSDSTKTRIEVGEHGANLVPGVVYLAPDNKHMEVSSSGKLVLTDEPSENGSRPSVSVLFRSVAQSYGPNAIGILLTGMGRDGARELRTMRDCGAITIAQDEETSAVHGMPGEAIRLKGARYILPPDRIISVVARNLPATARVEREPATC